MKKIFKWIGVVLGSLAGLILITAVGLYFAGNSHFTRTYDFPPSGVVAPTDAASIEYGKHRVETLCVDCHGGHDVQSVGRIVHRVRRALVRDDAEEHSARVDFPERKTAVLARGHDEVIVGRKRRRQDVVRVAAERYERRARFGRPDARGTVRTARQQPFAE